jgi:hypothetical protein
VNPRFWLAVACAQLVLLHLVAFRLHDEAPAAGLIVFLGSWAAFLGLCFLANRKRQPRKRRAPAIQQNGAPPAEGDAPEGASSS